MFRMFPLMFTLWSLSNHAQAIDIDPLYPPQQQTFRVDTSFNKNAFYDKEIIDFSFVKGRWSLEFDFSSQSFKPITDLLRITTNLPSSDIDSERYHLSMTRNDSACMTGAGGKGSQDIASVFVNVNENLEEVTELGVDIGGGALAFQSVGQTGLYAEHEVTLEFAPIVLGSDSKCVGVVKMNVELDI